VDEYPLLGSIDCFRVPIAAHIADEGSKEGPSKKNGRLGGEVPTPPQFVCFGNSIRELSLCGTRVQGSLQSLQCLSLLELLDLSGTQVSGRLFDVCVLSKLTHLSLSCTRVAGKLCDLRLLRRLQLLRLEDCTDVQGDLNQLSDLKCLEFIGLAGTNVSGRKGPLFHALPKLTSINIERTPVAVVEAEESRLSEERSSEGETERTSLLDLYDVFGETNIDGEADVDTSAAETTVGGADTGQVAAAEESRLSEEKSSEGETERTSLLDLYDVFGGTNIDGEADAETTVDGADTGQVAAHDNSPADTVVGGGGGRQADASTKFPKKEHTSSPALSALRNPQFEPELVSDGGASAANESLTEPSSASTQLSQNVEKAIPPRNERFGHSVNAAAMYDPFGPTEADDNSQESIFDTTDGKSLQSPRKIRAEVPASHEEAESEMSRKLSNSPASPLSMYSVFGGSDSAEFGQLSL
jgi:hypothetical protein